MISTSFILNINLLSMIKSITIVYFCSYKKSKSGIIKIGSIVASFHGQRTGGTNSGPMRVERFVGNSFPSICIFLLIYQLSYRRELSDGYLADGTCAESTHYIIIILHSDAETGVEINCWVVCCG